MKEKKESGREGGTPRRDVWISPWLFLLLPWFSSWALARSKLSQIISDGITLSLTWLWMRPKPSDPNLKRKKERKYDSLWSSSPLSLSPTQPIGSPSIFFHFSSLFRVVVNVFASSPSKSSKAFFLLLLSWRLLVLSIFQTWIPFRALFLIWGPVFLLLLLRLSLSLPHIQTNHRTTTTTVSVRQSKTFDILFSSFDLAAGVR